MANLPGADLSRLSDEELMRRVANVEAASFAVLYERHSVPAFSLARQMLGSTGANDVVQEAFLNVWRSAGRYDASRGSVRTWVLALVRNRSIDALRVRGAGDRRQIAMEALEERIATRDVPAEIVIDLARRERAAEVTSALASLPREQRRVLRLAYFGGWSQAEIAEYLDVPLGTVKGRARLGLDKLRDSLGVLELTSG